MMRERRGTAFAISDTMLSQTSVPARRHADNWLKFQRQLSAWNRVRLSPALPSVNWRERLIEDARLLELEGEFVEQERRAVCERATAAPCDADAFVAWFEALEENGPGQNDLLFPWLAESAPLESMRWFLQQEVAGEAGFDDLVAVSQVK